MPNTSWMKQENNVLYFHGDGELIYYVPEKYFELNIASIIGEYVEVMGMFAYALFDKTGKQILFKHFKCPTIFKCKPTKIEKINNFQLTGSKSQRSYRLLRFTDGFELMCSIAIPKTVDNVEKFVNLLIRGNLPDYIPYDEIQDYMIMNAQLNGFNYKVSNQVMGMVISELCRDSNDLSKPFRYTSMDDMTSYTMIPIMKVPKYTSPYTALTSENPDEAIASAITTTGTGSSPLEKVMMG